MDYTTYFNIAFFSILGLGLFFGFLKGLKKSIWGFFVTAIFFAVFFLTINQAVNLLWTINMPFLGGLLANVSPALANVTSLQDALPVLLEQFLGDTLQASLTNEHFLELVVAISLFALKLVYAILYFTVIQILYRLIFWIIRMIVLPSHKKDKKYRSKNRGLGAVFGLMSGVLSLYVTMIMFGGVISISESILSVLPAPTVTPQSQVVFRDGFGDPRTTVVPFAAVTNPLESAQFTDAYNMLEGMVNAYNENIVVQVQSQITMTSEYTGEEMPLNLYLFDEVLSMDYQEEQIAIRAELGIYANVAANVLNSDFMETNNFSDITGEDIRGIFTDLSESNLFTALIPIAVEVGADFLESEVTIPTDELYEIDWATEIMQLGEIAATAFDLVNAAGILNDSMDLNTITLDGDDVEQLFIELGESDLITLAAYVAIAPALEMAGAEIAAFITVPDDIDWALEFAAIGAVAGEILNTGITIGDFESGDPMALLGSLAEVDFTVLLGSQIVTNALINILSGNTSIVIPFLDVPLDIVWLDLLDNDGNITENGELRNILLAINALVDQADGFDLNNIDLNFIAGLDVDAINSLFESRILVATITQFIRELALPDAFTLIMPDSVFDENGDLLKLELQNVVEAVHMVLTELACADGDDVCLELGFDMNGILGLAEDNIDILLLSDILSATVGNLVLEMGGDMLTVPGTAKTTIYVDTVETFVVSKDEIKKAFLAISTLGITDIDNLTFDLSILNNLGTVADPTILDPDKAATLFASKVLNATLSTYLLDFATGAEALVVVPYEDENGIVIRVIDPIDGTEYISEDELTNILQAVLTIDITDINNLETLDLSLILDNVAVLLDSAILHATVSKQLLDLTDVVVVPSSVIVESGDVGQVTQFIAKLELENAFDALSVLGITDINNVAIDVSILTNLALESDSTVLDQTKADRLFSSTIINATLSKYIIDFTEGDSAMIVVPYENEDAVVIRTVDVVDGTQIISQAELTNILKAILALDITDFNNIETLDISLILDNVSVLMDSAIMQATISKQLLDLTEVVTIPGSVIVETGGVGQETTLITKAELEAAFDALSVLGITDINNVAIDVGILTNLATEADSTILDQAKADDLFSSTIINATLSKYIIDFTEGDAALVVVPYKDQSDVVVRTLDTDTTTEIISEAELTNILKAILALDIQDFNNIETLDLGLILTNVTVLLDSAIMHATVSKQLLDLTEVVTVPGSVLIETGDVGEETQFIAKTELQATFDALDVLGITDINNVTMDISILNNVATDADPTILDDTKAGILFDSTIINATISKFIFDFSTGDSALIVVPYKDESDVDVITLDSDTVTQIISETELTNILKAILILDIQDFNAVDSLDLDLIIDNSETILLSSIMHATISKQIFDLGDEVINVPYVAQDNTTLIRVTTGDILEEETEFIASVELEHVFDALSLLGITDINSFGGNIDFSAILSDPAKVDTLLASSVIQATISDQVISLGGTGEDALMVVPYKAEDGITDIRLTVGAVGYETEYIIRTEIKAVFDALDVLGISDVENFTGSVDLGLLGDPVTVGIVLASSTIQATISKQLIDLDDGSTIIVPFLAEDNSTEIRKTVGVVGYESEYVVKTELEAIFDALDVLGITDVESFGGNDDLDLSLLAEGNNADIVLASSMIQAIISRQVIDLDDVSAAIIVPYLADDDLTEIRIEVGVGLTLTNYVNKAELKELILSLDVLNLTDVSGFSGSVDLNLLSDDPTIDQVLSSSILQATISEQIINLGNDETLEVPYLTEDTLTNLRVTTGPGGLETEFLIATEIKAIIQALDVLGIGDVETFSGTIDLSLLSDQQTKDTVLASSVIQATISKQLLDIEDGSTFIIPYFEEDNLTAVVVEVGGLGQETTYISAQEISDLLTALDVLGLTDVTSFDSSDVNFSTFAQGTNAATMLESAIIQAIVSKQVLDLDVSNTIAVPYFKDDDLTALRVTVGPLSHETELVIASELEATIIALDILGVTDPSLFGGSVDISLFYDLPSRTTLLASSIMQATISKQVLDLGDIVLTVPVLASNGITEVRKLVGGVGEQTDYILRPEIHALFEALELLNITDITTFDGTVELSSLFASSTVEYDTNQDTMLASASMHATITKQITDLGAAILVVPDTDINSVAVQALVSGTNFVTKLEIKSLINAMDILGVTDITAFDGTVGLTSLFESSTIDYDTNQDIMLASASMHATITKQINDLGSAVLVVPDIDINIINVKVVVSGTDFITKTEIKSLINAMDILGVNDIATFDGSIGLTALFASTNPGTYDANQNTLLTSASMHATITKQIEDLGSAVLLVPDTDVYAAQVKVLVSGTSFMTKSEIKALINAMDILGVNDIATFDGTIGLTALFASTNPGTYDANQNTLLASASMHATITQQIDDLGAAVLLVPSTDVLGTSIESTVSLTHFITKTELKALFNAMDVLGITDITAFDGTIGLGTLALEADQNTVLASASMHATISQTLYDLPSAVLIIPIYTQDGDIEANRVQKTVSATDFVYKDEIKALINAFIDMGYTDLSNFGSSIDSSKFFSNPDLYLLSSSIHATLSDKLLNDTGGSLVIPDVNINNAITLRIIATDVYIEINETKALLDALDAMGLTDFSAISITTSAIFGADFDVLLASASMQATISSNILSGALDDSAAAGSGKLVIPNYFREVIAVATVADEWIEKVELKALLNSLETLGITDFSGSVNGSVVSGMNDTQLDTLLASGSMQVSIDNMLKGNANINTMIPDLALEDVYDMTNITTEVEIKAFIKATQQLGAGDITNVTFSVALLAAMTPTERDIALDSMIVRNMLTDELETMMLADDPIDLYWPANGDYMLSNPALFLTEAGINLVLTHYGLI